MSSKKSIARAWVHGYLWSDAQPNEQHEWIYSAKHPKVLRDHLRAQADIAGIPWKAVGTRGATAFTLPKDLALDGSSFRNPDTKSAWFAAVIQGEGEKSTGKVWDGREPVEAEAVYHAALELGFDVYIVDLYKPIQKVYLAPGDANREKLLAMPFVAWERVPFVVH